MNTELTKTPKLILLGWGECGKGTLCKLLKERYNISVMSGSLYASHEFMFDKLKDKFGYESPEQCFNDRRNHRQVWATEINEFNTPDQTRLARRLSEDHNGYDGIRRRKELNPVKEANLFDLSIWIDASERLEPEATMDITKEDADIIIDNNTTEEDFISRSIKLFDALFPHRVQPA